MNIRFPLKLITQVIQAKSKLLKQKFKKKKMENQLTKIIHIFRNQNSDCHFKRNLNLISLYDFLFNNKIKKRN